MNETISAEEYVAMQAKQTTRKYRNEPVEEDGHRFDSKAERARYRELKLMRAAGEISYLELQPDYPLIVNGVKIGTYIADFCYETDHGTVVEDVKSPATRTPVFRIKKKLVKALYGIEIVEVMPGR